MMSVTVIEYHLSMGRWEPGAGERLEKAALELFIEEGYERTTVAEIAARAGVTERTFFRYFSDKREVLFGGGPVLEDFLVKLVAQAPASVGALDAVAGALETVAVEIFAERRDFARRRQTVINANTGLQERELLKLASLTAAVAATLRARGASEPGASLVSESAVAVFKTAFMQWVSEDDVRSLRQIITQTFAELKAVVA
jgi:AcrR family transcriptional regulator